MICTFDVTFAIERVVSASCSCGGTIVDDDGIVNIRAHLVAAHGFNANEPISVTVTGETLRPRRLSFEARTDAALVEQRGGDQTSTKV